MLVDGKRGVRARRRYRHDLRDELAGCDGGRRTFLAARREAILVLPRDAEALGDVLGGHAHRIPAERVGDERERSVDELARPELPALRAP